MGTIQHSPDLGYGTIVPLRTVRNIDLRVAPGEPDDPYRAKKFVLSWWEKDPPPEAYPLKGGLTYKDGWCFVTKLLGEKGRELVGLHPLHEQVSRLWVAMFGPTYGVRLAQGDDE
jgi:hypothetical protein